MVESTYSDGKKGPSYTTLVVGGAELNATEQAFLDGVTAGVAAASKAVVLDANKDIATIRHLTISGNLVTGATTLTEAELGVLDAVTPGTAAASKALTLDANSKLDGLPLIKRSLTPITLVNLQNLAATPIELVAAPAAGSFIQVLAWRFRLIFVATAIDDAAADGNLIIKYAGGGTIDTMEADALVDAAANTQGVSNVLTELIAADTAIDATAVQLSNDGAEYTVVGGGDSTAEVEVFYRILDTNPS